MSVGERLREKRQRAGLTLGQVGEYEGVTPQYLSDLERGRNQPNTWHLLARLAQRYHTSADYLLGLEATPPAAPETPEAEIMRLWAELDADQRNLVLDFLGMLKKARTPRIIGGEEEEGAG
jgi:transcriptional regulator with XRE-family HTH domain